MSNANAGYVYILQNDSHDNLVLKIGLTRNKPVLRAKQLYWGATGVPEHFDIAVAYKVGNCVEAEAEIHRRLDTYRINPKREFFLIDPVVAQKVALSTCEKINSKLGESPPEALYYENDNSKNYIKPIPRVPELKGREFETKVMPIENLKIAPVGTSKLTDEQIDRANIVYLIISEVCHNSSSEEFLEDFTRDKYPEPEIVIWENIAKIYQIFESREKRSLAEKKEAYQFILGASMFHGDELKNMIGNTKMSYESMESIVSTMQKKEEES